MAKKIKAISEDRFIKMCNDENIVFDNIDLKAMCQDEEGRLYAITKLTSNTAVYYFNGVEAINVNGKKIKLIEYINIICKKRDKRFRFINNILPKKPEINKIYTKEELLNDKAFYTFIEYMGYLMGDNAKIMIEFYSILFQQMLTKDMDIYPFVMALYGVQGNGKSYILNMFNEAFGKGNWYKINNFSILGDGYNYNLYGKTVVLMDDGDMPHNKREYNYVKDFTSAKEIIFRQKFMTDRLLKNYSHLVICANDDDYYIDSNDRRIYVIPTNPTMANSKELIEKIQYMEKNRKEIVNKLRFLMQYYKVDKAKFYTLANQSQYKHNVSSTKDNTINAVTKMLFDLSSATFDDKYNFIKDGLIHFSGIHLASYLNKINPYYTRINVTPRMLSHYKLNGRNIFLSEKRTKINNINTDCYCVSIKDLEEYTKDLSLIEIEKKNCVDEVVNNIEINENIIEEEINDNEELNPNEDLSYLEEIKDESEEEEQISEEYIMPFEELTINDIDYERKYDANCDDKQLAVYDDKFRKYPNEIMDYNDYDKSYQFELLNEFNDNNIKERTNDNAKLSRLLFEMDNVPLKEQYDLIKELVNEKKFPIRRVTYSGNKSLHFIIEMDDESMPKNKDEYKFIWKLINQTVFNGKCDNACSNNARLTRRPNGVNIKTGNVQKMVFHSKNRLKLNWRDIMNKQPKKEKVSYSSVPYTNFDFKKLYDKALRDDKFKKVFMCEEREPGTRNELKCHAVGVLKSMRAPIQLIYEILERFLGDLNGENSIDSLLYDYE